MDIPKTKRPTTPINTEQLSTSRKINFTGAFIDDEDRPSDSHHDSSDIILPNHSSFTKHIALDIGGSLAKVVYYSPDPDHISKGGRLRFLKFETDRIDECLQFVQGLRSEYHEKYGAHAEELVVIATGGGAYKYYDRMKEVLGLAIIKEDEMECLIIGLDFFIREIPREVFRFSEGGSTPFLEPRADVYPYLMVNIGSGVSMIKVSGPRQYERIGGTSLGGGTLWGLLSLMTGARTFDDMLALADKGDNTRVDMLVGDIYGTDYSKVGLETSTIASSFGKVFNMKRTGEDLAQDGTQMSDSDTQPMSDMNKDSRTFGAADISRSLLFAISYNIGQIAYLFSEKYQLADIYFGGSFIRGHRQTMDALTFAISFWSQNKKQAYFLRHEGYLGAIGAFMKG